MERLQDESDVIFQLECKEIPEFVHRIAQTELGETDKTREKCLHELRKKISSEACLNSDTSTNFLLQFLRARRFDTEIAFLLLKSYYKHRLKYSILYRSYSPRQTYEVMKENFIGLLANRAPDGSAIYVVKFGLWNPEVTSFEDLLRFGLLCNEKAIDNPVTQICGMTSIVDLKGLSWSHLSSIPTSMVKCFVSASQDCFPIRHKAIHVINNHSIFAILFAILKPLINKKIRDRIHFHGDNLKSLHQYVPPNVLPHEFGGTQVTFFSEQFYNSLLDSEEEFQRRNRYGYEMKADTC